MNQVLSKLTENLIDAKDIELMYYDIDINTKTITFNVIVDDANINNDKDSFLNIITTMQKIKEGLAKRDINFNFSIRSSGSYSVDNIDVESIIFASEKATRGVKR